MLKQNFVVQVAGRKGGGKGKGETKGSLAKDLGTRKVTWEKPWADPPTQKVHQSLADNTHAACAGNQSRELKYMIEQRTTALYNEIRPAIQPEQLEGQIKSMRVEINGLMNKGPRLCRAIEDEVRLQAL